MKFSLPINATIRCLLLLLIAIVASYYAYPSMQQQLTDFLYANTHYSPQFYQWHVWLMILLLWLPFIFALYYYSCSIIHRYILRRFISIFGFCFITLLALLLLVEMKGSIFKLINQANYIDIIIFYAWQIPSFSILILPYTLMIAILSFLHQITQSNEFTAFSQTGKPPWRTLSPLIVSTLFISFCYIACNYYLAPYGSRNKKHLLAHICQQKNHQLHNLIAYIPKHNRLWFVGKSPFLYAQKDSLNKLVIQQFDHQQQLKKVYTAERGVWLKPQRQWQMQQVTIYQFLTFSKSPIITTKPILTMSWQEAPGELIQPYINTADLHLPELFDKVFVNRNDEQMYTPILRSEMTYLHKNLAMSSYCLLIALISIPLGLRYTHRSGKQSIGKAFIIGIMILFSSTTLPTMAEGGYISPFLGGWGTMLLFGGLAIIPCYRKYIKGAI